MFVNEPIDGIRAMVAQTGINTVQLHGDEPPAYADALEWPLIRAVDADEVEDACAAWSEQTTLLLDTIDPVRRGGTGVPVDWTLAAGVARTRRLVLAGGLTPENVASAIRAVRPYGVDVSSGVELSPGVKDFGKVARFIANARQAFERKSQQAEGGRGSEGNSLKVRATGCSGGAIRMRAVISAPTAGASCPKRSSRRSRSSRPATSPRGRTRRSATSSIVC